jgi:hypothetical protein
MTNIISFGWFKPNELHDGLWSEDEKFKQAYAKEMIAIMSDEYSSITQSRLILFLRRCGKQQ